MKYKTVKPFIKWAGGKGQLLNKFEELYPQELIEGKIETYIEPFVGGGAVLFNVLQNYQIKKAYINDINKELINCYRCIKTDVEEVIKQLDILEKEYYETEESRRNNGYGAEALKLLLDYGFNTYKVNLIKSKNDILGKIKVDKGKNEYVDVILKNEYVFM